MQQQAGWPFQAGWRCVLTGHGVRATVTVAVHLLAAPWAARPGLRLYTVLVMLLSFFFFESGCGSWMLWED
jgi:hypothetical protein